MYFLEHIRHQFYKNILQNFAAGGEGPGETTESEVKKENPDVTPESARALERDAGATVAKMGPEAERLTADVKGLPGGEHVGKDGDVLAGGGGSDKLTGGEAGDDTLVGQSGKDILGDGGDTVVDEGEPTEEEIAAEEAANEAEIARLKASENPDDQKRAVYLEAVRSNTASLNPTDAETINALIEEFISSEKFADLSPEELQAEIDAIMSGVISPEQERLAEETAFVNSQMNAPGTTPAQARSLAGRARANNYNSSVMNGNASWEGLDDSDTFQSSKFRSEPAETNPETGVTLCSRTAWKNLTKMTEQEHHRGSSAKDSYGMYGKQGDTGFPTSNSTAKFADVYLDASPKNAQYGHRAAAFQENGKWFCLDPYYAIPGQPDRLAPIPAETYLNHMCGAKGRKFWGAHYPGGGSQEGSDGSSAAMS